jgi:beta-barrel assembly-enhancing protease
MKRWAPLAIIVLACIAAIIAVQRKRIATRPSAQAVLSAGADAQHELTRLPAHLERMSDSDEIATGNALADSYSSAWRLKTDSDRAEQAYITSLGTAVAAHARRKLPWRFHYVPDRNFVNAFALPGGHVFIGRGLLNLMHSEDALAAVLGHEIEHVDLRHCAERAQTEARLRNLGTLGTLVGLPVEVFTAGYSKDQELEADRDGTTLAVQTGYSPAGILQLFDEFRKLEQGSGPRHDPHSPVDESAQLSLQTLSGYFRSHPPSTERADQIRRLMLSGHWPTPPLRPLNSVD